MGLFYENSKCIKCFCVNLFIPYMTISGVTDLTHATTPLSTITGHFSKCCQIETDYSSCSASVLTRGPIDTEQNQASQAVRASLSSLR